MVNWKEFKNWLEKEIIIQEGSKVKIKPELKNLYKRLSEVTLTNFYDSLEATLDKNNNYHLFPIFTEEKSFEEIFIPIRCYFGKKSNQERISEKDYLLLEKIFYQWKKEKINQEAELDSLGETYKKKRFDNDTDNKTWSEKEKVLRDKLDQIFKIFVGEPYWKKSDLIRVINLTEGFGGTDNQENCPHLWGMATAFNIAVKEMLNTTETKDEVTKIKELQSKLVEQEQEINCLKNQLKRLMSKEQYQSQIEKNK